MTHRPNNLTADELPSGKLPLGVLETQWPLIEKVARDIADEVDIKSEGLSGNFSKQALAISNFFRDSPDYDRALNQSTVLAIANPLAQLAHKQEITKQQIAKAVNIGLCTLSRHGTTHRSLFRIFIYPIMLTYFLVFGAILIAHYIMPYFAEMYADFGIAVPSVTNMFINLFYTLRLYTSTILLVFLGLPPLLWLLNWIDHEKRPPGMTRLDVLLSRKRPSVSRWLLHFSLLIEAGLSKQAAIARASSISGKRWIRNKSKYWQSRSSGEFADSSHRFFERAKLRTADTAIEMPRSRGQLVLLQHVATWDRDSSSKMSEV